MKNVLKRRVAPLIGIVAMLAAIGFMMTACGEEEAAPPPLGDLSIEAEYGIAVGYPLKAVWAGKEDVYFLWLYANMEDNLKATTTQQGVEGYTLGSGRIFNPESAGSYKVAAINQVAADAWQLDTTKPMPQFTFSPAVAVTATKPANSPFLGKWEMKGSENGNWTGGGTSVNNETVVITQSKFRLDSTWQGFSTQDMYPLSASGRGGADDLGAPFEYIEFAITRWETASVPSSLTGFTVGQKLTVTCTGYKGYEPYTEFFIYANSSGSQVTMQRSNQTDPSPYTVLSRVYKQIQKPEDIEYDDDGEEISGS